MFEFKLGELPQDVQSHWAELQELIKYPPSDCDAERPVFCRLLISVICGTDSHGLVKTRRHFVTGYNRIVCPLVGKNYQMNKKATVRHAETEAMQIANVLYPYKELEVTALVTRAPCFECAEDLRYFGGLGAVICPAPEPESKWFQSQKDALDKLEETGVAVIILSEDGHDVSE